MLVRTTRSQIAFMLRQKEGVFTFWVLMLLVMVSFAGNCWAFRGSDILELVHTTKMGLLSWNRTSYNADMTMRFVQLYPLLVVCPAGFVLAKERGTQEHVLMITRMGSKVYYFSKLISAFVVTAVVFALPFLMEIVIHIIAFSLSVCGGKGVALQPVFRAYGGFQCGGVRFISGEVSHHRVHSCVSSTKSQYIFYCDIREDGEIRCLVQLCHAPRGGSKELVDIPDSPSIDCFDEHRSNLLGE